MLALPGSTERSVKSRIRGGKCRCALEKFGKLLFCRPDISEVRVRRSQDRVNVREFGIGPGRLCREFHRFCVPLRQQCCPALAQVPDHQQRVARTEANRLVKEWYGGFIIAGEAIATAEI